jgi:LTXXQ motif family protein
MLYRSGLLVGAVLMVAVAVVGAREPAAQLAAAAPGQPGSMMPMMGMGGDMMMGGGPGMPMMMAQRMAQHVEGRLAFLKTELKITPAQEPQWNAFADVVRANAKAMMDAHPAAAATPMRLPERLGLHEKMLAAHLEALGKLNAALTPLYAALSDEQKQTADELMLGPMGPR